MDRRVRFSAISRMMDDSGFCEGQKKDFGDVGSLPISRARARCLSPFCETRRRRNIFPRDIPVELFSSSFWIDWFLARIRIFHAESPETFPTGILSSLVLSLFPVVRGLRDIWKYRKEVGLAGT